tara:strand:+ start:2715 stop:3182 length:468 start_codon:yes stop_codon:yes gene_type:complete
MNINLVSDNFLDTLLDNEIKIEDGVETTVPGKEKTILGMCFHQSIKNKVYPAEFEANIKKGSIRINPIDKPEITQYIGGEAWKDGFLCWKHSLDDRQVLHFTLIYRLSYLRHFYPEKFNKIEGLPVSKNMNEYFNNSEEELQKVHNNIKVNVGAN